MRNLIDRFFAFANISYTMFTVRSNVKDRLLYRVSSHKLS